MDATIGRIVHYRVAEHDLDVSTPPGAVGNALRAGDIYPAMIVRTFGKAVNLQVFVDGNCTLWATSRTEGDANGQWFWPPRV